MARYLKPRLARRVAGRLSIRATFSKRMFNLIYIVREVGKIEGFLTGFALI